MFRNWGFLLGEIWVLLALAGLVGLFAGWLIWSRRQTHVDLSGDLAERDRRIAALERELSDLRSRPVPADLSDEVAVRDRRIGDLERDLAECRSSQAAAATAPAAALMASTGPVRPARLDGPRGGKGDDLKRIKGIGPKLEALCNSLGFWHFDQIAAWTPAEVNWVDQNLQGFTGRVSRDNWIEQARVLAAGGETEFSKRVDKGDVY
jgi:predicted flap endonuclease-1-like 5' DNA nuclease